jgi:hypothetical protein
LPLTDDQLKEVALHSGVLEVEEDFLDAEFRKKCEFLIHKELNQVIANVLFCTLRRSFWKI